MISDITANLITTVDIDKESICGNFDIRINSNKDKKYL